MLTKFGPAFLAASILVTAFVQVGAAAAATPAEGSAYIPYLGGVGDPAGYTLTPSRLDGEATGSVEKKRVIVLPYTNGLGDPEGLTLTVTE